MEEMCGWESQYKALDTYMVTNAIFAAELQQWLSGTQNTNTLPPEEEQEEEQKEEQEDKEEVKEWDNDSNIALDFVTEATLVGADGVHVTHCEEDVDCYNENGKLNTMHNNQT